jgi:hypothetical protein
VEDGLLKVRDVEVLRSDRQQTLVSSGLAQGDQVVVSTLDAVTDGMKVRISNGDPLQNTPTEGDETGGTS